MRLAATVQADLLRLETRLVAELLPAAASAQYLKGDISHATLLPIAEAIRAISGRYTGDDADVVQPESAATYHPTPPSLSNVESAAYALYYLTINYAKLRALLGRVTIAEPPRILDFGAGPGTGWFALTDALPHCQSYTAVESAPGMSSILERLTRSHPIQPRIVSRLDQLPAGVQFDVILAANVLNELEGNASTIIETLRGRLAPQGVLIILEPGTPRATYTLMAVRDTLCAGTAGLVPLFPCTHQHPCPMRRTKDWCHTSLSWEPPPLIRQLDKLTGFNKHRLKFSALIARNGGVVLDGYRVLSAPEKSRRGVEAHICGATYYGSGYVSARSSADERQILRRARMFDRFEATAVLPSGQVRGITVLEQS